MLLKIGFVASLTAFSLLLGALLGGTVLGGSGGHGLESLGDMLTGALVGLLVGLIAGISLLVRWPDLPIKGLLISTSAGSIMVLGIIAWLEGRGSW